MYSSSDGTEISHNNFITMDSNLLKTQQGVQDPMNMDTNNRIGDEINLRGAKLKFMLELNERYSDVTFRVLVVKCAKGDTPTRATLFAGMSGNKMLDNINKERYTVLAQKYIQIKAPNSGTTGPMSTQIPFGDAGFYRQEAADQRLSRATRIVKMWIPGKKFSKTGVIKYEDGNSSQVKFFDYHVLVYAYSNYSTNQDVWNVGRVNDYIKTLYFKDA